MSRPSRVVLIALLGFSIQANAQSSVSNKLLFIDSIHVTGTRSLDTAQLNEIIGPLNQLKVDSSDEIEDRLRIEFQEHGYFDVEVKSVSVKPLDPLANPTPVDVHAEVLEGPRFVFGDIQFTGIHMFSADELRKKFPLHPGDWFSRSAVATGVRALVNLYLENGYIDSYAFSDAQKAGEAKVTLHFDVHEGDQYRMGALQFAGSAENGEQLRVRWQLEPGKPFDYTYLEKFLNENGSLLPAHFEMSRSTKIARDCQNHTVTVYIELSPDHPNVTPPNDVGCDKKSTSPAE